MTFLNCLSTLLCLYAFLSGIHAEGQIQFKYTGAGSCSAKECHGAEKPSTDASFTTRNNEYTIWYSKDAHSRAYDGLSKDISKTILSQYNKATGGTETDPGKADKCMTCHATGDASRIGLPGLDYKAYASADHRDKNFDIEGGVSCDSCHGPAEKWLKPHAEKGWVNSQRAKFTDRRDLLKALGLIDTKDIMMRADNCISCHLRIDSAMMEAGHPPLRFELASYSRKMPPHWKKTDPWIRPKAWAAGQAASAREALAQLAEYASGKSGNDAVAAAWTKAKGHLLLVRHTVPDKFATGINATIKSLDALSKDPGKRADLSKAATAATASAESWRTHINGLKFDGPAVLSLLHKVTVDTASVSLTYASADQTGQGIVSLYITYRKSGEKKSSPVMKQLLKEIKAFAAPFKAKTHDDRKGKIAAYTEDVRKATAETSKKIAALVKELM